MPNVDAEYVPGVTNVEKKTLEQGELSLWRNTSHTHISRSALTFFAFFVSPLKLVLFLGRRRREHIDEVCV